MKNVYEFLKQHPHFKEDQSGNVGEISYHAYVYEWIEDDTIVQSTIEINNAEDDSVSATLSRKKNDPKAQLWKINRNEKMPEWIEELKVKATKIHEEFGLC